MGCATEYQLRICSLFVDRFMSERLINEMGLTPSKPKRGGVFVSKHTMFDMRL